MVVSAQQLFRDLKQGKRKPLNLVVGEEPFQADEILSKFKSHLIGKGKTEAQFNYESFDGNDANIEKLMASLDTLPGLFDLEAESSRLVIFRHVEKASPSSMEQLHSYFENPSETTCLLMFCTKADKRKAWYKAINQQGNVTEVSDPYDKDWPKWQGYMERKAKKRIEPAAWEILVQSSQGALSLLWSEIEKVSLYIGDKEVIQTSDLHAFPSSASGKEIFSFVDDVLCRRQQEALSRYYRLLQGGENQVKILSLLVRQFRFVAQTLRWQELGSGDNKQLAAQLGLHPFLASRVIGQSRFHSPSGIGKIMKALGECDFKMKTGSGDLFVDFLVPYFSVNKK